MQCSRGSLYLGQAAFFVGPTTGSCSYATTCVPVYLQNHVQQCWGCVKVEVDVLGSPSLLIRTVSVDNIERTCIRAQELCECRGGRPGVPDPNSPYGL